MMEHWIAITLLLGFLSLDATAVGQFMLSRPVAVGALVGLLTGHPEVGLLVGALVELIWIGEVPVGSHLPADLLILAGVATALAAELVKGGAPPEAAMTFAIGTAIPLAILSTELEGILRRLHVRWAHFAQRMAGSGHFGTFDGVNSLVILGLFLKGLLTAAAALFVAHLAGRLFRLLPDRAVDGLYYAHWLLLALGCSAAIDLMVEKKTSPFLVLSIVTALTAAFFQIPGVWMVSGALLAGFILTLIYAGKGETA
jgi:mannose/fructose/N-acetylgalactosamine-specific phosphotransferase system component IIC